MADEGVYRCSPPPPPPPHPSSYVIKLDSPTQPTNNGRVLVYQYGQWDPVAATGNTTALATVICGQLGFAGGIATAEGIYAPVQQSGQMSLNCTGEEATIADCAIGPDAGGQPELELACYAPGGRCIKAAQ